MTARGTLVVVAALALAPVLVSAQTAEDFEVVADGFEGGVTYVAAAPDGTLWVVTPSRLYRSVEPFILGASPTATPAPESPTGSPSGTASPATPSEPGSESGAFTAGRLIVIALLVSGLILMRNRLLRR